MKKITLLFALMVVSLGYSQQVLIEDFESSPAFDSWDGAAVVVGNDPVGSNLQNMQVDVTSGNGQFWQGAKVTLPASIVMDLTTDVTVVVDIYSTTAMTIMGKVESNSGAPAAADDENHGGTGWETITFTFNTGADGTTTANGNYNLFAVFPNRDGAGGWTNPWASSTTYYDNITAVLGTVTPTCIDGIQNGNETGVDCGGPDCAPCVTPPATAAPTPPARNASDVISLFSNAYNDITINTWSAVWDDSNVDDVQIAGNDTKKITFTNFIGVEFQSSRFDATSFTHFHIDMYTTTPTLDKSFNLKFSNWAGGAGEANAIEFSTTNASNPALPNPNPGTWISLDMPLSSWTAGSRADLVQFLITSNLGVVYVDNIYVYKGTPLGLNDFDLVSFKVFPNPAQDSWTVKTKNENMSSIQVFDILGKKVLSLSPNSNEVKIEGSRLTTGLYFAHIKTSTGINSVKLVKQ